MTVTSWNFWGATDLSSYVILLAIFVGAPITVVVALSKTQLSLMAVNLTRLRVYTIPT